MPSSYARSGVAHSQGRTFGVQLAIEARGVMPTSCIVGQSNPSLPQFRRQSIAQGLVIEVARARGSRDVAWNAKYGALIFELVHAKDFHPGLCEVSMRFHRCVQSLVQGLDVLKKLP